LNPQQVEEETIFGKRTAGGGGPNPAREVSIRISGVQQEVPDVHGVLKQSSAPRGEAIALAYQRLLLWRCQLSFCMACGVHVARSFTRKHVGIRLGNQYLVDGSIAMDSSSYLLCYHGNM